MQEKRRSFRLPVELPATFKLFEEQDHVSLALINEISALGFSFTTKEFVSPGEEITITIRFPPKGGLSAEGSRLALPVKTIWSRQESFVDTPEYFVGVKLLEPLTQETAQYIRQYVRYFFRAFNQKISEQ